MNVVFLTSDAVFKARQLRPVRPAWGGAGTTARRRQESDGQGGPGRGERQRAHPAPAQQPWRGAGRRRGPPEEPGVGGCPCAAGTRPAFRG